MNLHAFLASANPYFLPTAQQYEHQNGVLPFTRASPALFSTRLSLCGGDGRPRIAVRRWTFVEGTSNVEDFSGGRVEVEEEEKNGWIHFVGIGGSGLSALAMLALKQGFEVSGSDIAWSYFMDGLNKAGATLFIGHSISNLQRNNGSTVPSAIVISSAIPADNVEVLHAKSVGIPMYKRDAWLGKITEQNMLIAVSGTHGKSTTTGMLSYVLDAMGHDITAIVGAHVPQLPSGNTISRGGPIFVLEADEYDGCFLGISPFIVVVTNVEWEHVDFFRDEEAVTSMYRRFLHQIKDGGHLILCGDSAGACALLSGSRQETVSGSDMVPKNSYYVTTYGIYRTNEWWASSIMPNLQGGVDYILHHWDSPVAEISLQLPGVHNVLNSLAVIAAVMKLTDCYIHKVADDRKQMYPTLDLMKFYLNKFKGISRRFEMIGKLHGCYIYDDYAHHPTEISAAIHAARQRYPYQILWVVFQPHTFSRLAMLMKDFVDAFTGADHVIVTEIFASRERNIWNIDGKDLADRIIGPSSEYIPKLGDVVDKLVLEVSSRSNQEIITLTLGAGDVTKVGSLLLDRLQQRLESSST